MVDGASGSEDEMVEGGDDDEEGEEGDDVRAYLPGQKMEEDEVCDRKTEESKGCLPTECGVWGLVEPVRALHFWRPLGLNPNPKP